MKVSPSLKENARLLKNCFNRSGPLFIFTPDFAEEGTFDACRNKAEKDNVKTDGYEKIMFDSKFTCHVSDSVLWRSGNHGNR